MQQTARPLPPHLRNCIGQIPILVLSFGICLTYDPFHLHPFLNLLAPLPLVLSQDQEAPSGLDLVRCIATARIVMPRTVVRLSAGRLDLSPADQALAFMAGANSIFDGDKLLTTANNDRNEDEQMFDMLGLKSRPAFMPYASGNDSSRSFEGQEGAAGAAAVAGGGGGCCGGGCGSGAGKQQEQVAAVC